MVGRGETASRGGEGRVEGRRKKDEGGRRSKKGLGKGGKGEVRQNETSGMRKKLWGWCLS